MFFLQRIIDEHWLPLTSRLKSLILGMAFAIAVLIIALVTSNQSQPVSNPFQTSDSLGSRSESPEPVLEQKLMVHVVGEVENPGVYQLSFGARVLDAVAAAGGFTSKADQTSINLVRPMSDGEQLIVLGRSASAKSSAGQSLGLTGAAAGVKVNINSAGATQLDSLPGIGPTLAARIIDYRTSNGGFRSISDLGRVSGIGPKLLAQIANLVTL